MLSISAKARAWQAEDLGSISSPASKKKVLKVYMQTSRK